MLEIDAGYTASRSLRWRTRRRDGSSVKPTTTSPSAAQLRDIRLPDGRARLETGATKGAGAFFTSPECDRNVEPEAVMRRLFANLVMHTPPGSKERER
jgi:hypothetical protein